ncbi:MAG: hypothetical protein DRN37_11850 [Thermoplasmata archaeon]|nr:MAG: hypothetical protein DRN37_11850 [Thermoplasmata archaeon]
MCGLVLFALLKGWSSRQTVVVMIILTGQIMEGVADTFFNLYRAEGRQVREGLYRTGTNLIGVAYGTICLLTGLGIVALAFFLIISNGLKLVLAATGVVRLGLASEWFRTRSLLPAAQVPAVLTVAGVSGLGSFYNYIQVFFLKQFHDLKTVAFYGAAADFSGFIAGFVTLITIGAVLFPALATTAVRNPEELPGRVHAYFWQLLTHGTGVAFFLATLGGWILVMVYGPKYGASVAPLRILGPATLLSFLNNFGVYVLLALRQEKRLFLYHLFPASLSLVLGMVLIPYWGATGAALNLLACRIAMAVLIIGWLQRNMRVLSRPEIRRILKAFLPMAVVFLLLVGIQPLVAGVAGLAAYMIVTWQVGGFELRLGSGEGSHEKSRKAF